MPLPFLPNRCRVLGQWELFCQEVEQWQQLGYRVVILTSSRQRLRDHRYFKLNVIFQHLCLNRNGSHCDSCTAAWAATLFYLTELAVLAEQDICAAEKAPPFAGPGKASAWEISGTAGGRLCSARTAWYGSVSGVAHAGMSGVQRDYLYIQYAGT